LPDEQNKIEISGLGTTKIVVNGSKLSKIVFRNKNTPSVMATKIIKNRGNIFVFAYMSSMLLVSKKQMRCK
jgi:hypothetical protein